MTLVASNAMAALVAQLFPGNPPSTSPISFSGDELHLSRHHYGAAAAAAAGAYAYGISRLWQVMTGVEQRACINLGRATVPGLRTSSHLWQNGYRLPYGRPPLESANFFQAKDGRRLYVLRISQYASLVSGVLKLLECNNETEALSRAVARWDSDALEDALAERGLLGCIARTRDEWLAHPQGIVLNAMPPVSVTRIADSAPQPLKRVGRPLESVRVLDMAHVLAGPVAARMLAEQGADVLHATAPLVQEDIRVVMDTGFGKRNTFIDLARPDGVATARSLLESADVFIQSFRPGSLGRKGFSPLDLAALRPGIIYVSVSAYGSDGPWAARGGLDPVGQAVSGLCIAEGSSDAPVLAPTMTLNDYLSAYLAASGVTSALLQRSLEGGSYHVQVSLTRCSMWLQELGRTPSSCWPDHAASYGDGLEAREADMTETQTVFGRLRHPRPLVDFSATPAYFAGGPTPLGSAPATWATISDSVTQSTRS